MADVQGHGAVKGCEHVHDTVCFEFGGCRNLTVLTAEQILLSEPSHHAGKSPKHPCARSVQRHGRVCSKSPAGVELLSWSSPSAGFSWQWHQWSTALLLAVFPATASFYPAYFIVPKCLCGSLGTENLPVTQRVTVSLLPEDTSPW